MKIVHGDYVGEAKDEPLIYSTYLGERKREFIFNFITSAEAQEVAEELLEANKHIKVYYDCVVRGNPYVNLLDAVKLTAPQCSADSLDCQIIRIDHTIEAGKWVTILGLVAEIKRDPQIMHLDDDKGHVSSGWHINQNA